MATTLERTIAIIFEGDDRTGPAFNSVSGSIGTFTTNVEAIAGKLAGVADTVIELDLALAALAIGGLAFATAKAGEFNSSTAEVGTLISDTTFDMDRFRESVLNYANESTQSIGDINSALYAAVSAGTSWEQSIDAVAAAEKLAVSGKAELTDSTVLLLSTMNAYGAEMDEASRYSDVFFQTVKLGQTTIPELAQSLSSVTTIAAGAQVPIETVAAAVADLTAKGMPTAEAMTAIRGVLQEIIKPSEQAAAMAESLGIEFNASALASKGLEGVLWDVYSATGGNVDQIAQLFGNVRGLTGVLAMFGADGGDAFLGRLEAMRTSSGSVAEAYAKMANELENVNQRLVNNMTSTFIKVGQPLLDDWAGVADGIAGIFQGIDIGIDQHAFDPIFDLIESTMGKLGTFLQEVGNALPEALGMVDFTEFTNALTELGDAAADYLGGLDLTTPEDLAKALQTAVDVITGLVDITKGMVEAFRPFIEEIAEFVIEVSKGDAELTEFIGKLFAWAKMISEAGLELTLMIAAMQASGEKWGPILEAVHNTASIFWNFIQTVVQTVVMGLLEMAKAANELLDILTLGQFDVFQENINRIEKLQEQVTEGYLRDAGEMTDAMGGLFKQLLGIEEGGDAAAEGMKKAGDAAEGAAGLMGDAAEGADGLADSVDKIPDEKSIEFETKDPSDVRNFLYQMGIDLAKIPEEKIMELAMARDAETWNSVMGEIKDLSENGQVITIEPEVSEAQLTEIDRLLDEAFPDEDIVEVKPEADETSLANTKRDVDEVAETRTATVEVETDEAELERIKGQFQTIQDAVEWKAKLDIAEVEANAQTVEALAGTLSSAFESSGQVISSALDAWKEIDSGFQDLSGERAFLEGVIERELDIRERAMMATEELVATQVDYMQAKINALSSGDALVTIDGAGLQPHLESFMWEVLSAIQTRVNEEGHAMLFGI